jgi:thioredoxin-related protein
MKYKIVFLLFVFFFVSLNLYSQEKSKVKKETAVLPSFDPSRNAAKDIKTAIAEAKKTNKRIYVDVGGEWCIWCHRIDEFYQTHKDLYSYLKKHYVFVKINYSKENKNEKVLSHYPKIEGYPHVFILDKNGKLLKSKDTGELEKGKGYDYNKFKVFLKKWSNTSHKI